MHVILIDNSYEGRTQKVHRSVNCYTLKILQLKMNISFFCSAHCKKLLEISNLTDIERKMALYKAMFYCNNPGDRNPNYIKADSLRIELMAGGLNWDQQEYVMDQMQPSAYREVSTTDNIYCGKIGTHLEYSVVCKYKQNH